MGRVFANGPGDRGSIPGRVIPKTFKMVLDTSLLNTRQYKVRIEGKVEQSRERSSSLPLHLGVVASEKGAFWSLSTTVASFTYLHYKYPLELTETIIIIIIIAKVTQNLTYSLSPAFQYHITYPISITIHR